MSGVHNESPQDRTLWYSDSFEVKATLSLSARETSAHPQKLPTRIRGLAHHRWSGITSIDPSVGQANFSFLKVYSSNHPAMTLGNPKGTLPHPYLGMATYPKPPFYLWTSRACRVPDSFRYVGFPIHQYVFSLGIFSCQSTPCLFDDYISQKNLENGGKFVSSLQMASGKSMNERDAFCFF